VQSHQADPGRRSVVWVLDYFSREAVRTGWWSQTPRWRVGDERYSSVAARLKDGRTVVECLVAVNGALSQDPRRTKRAYVDVTSVFRNNANFERAYEHGVDPELRRAGRHVRVVPRLLLPRWREVEDQAGHVLVRPHPVRPPARGSPCGVHGCVGCPLGFDLDVDYMVGLELAERQGIGAAP
jgi:hypothetical protein